MRGAFLMIGGCKNSLESGVCISSVRHFRRHCVNTPCWLAMIACSATKDSSPITALLSRAAPLASAARDSGSKMAVISPIPTPLALLGVGDYAQLWLSPHTSPAVEPIHLTCTQCCITAREVSPTPCVLAAMRLSGGRVCHRWRLLSEWFCASQLQT